MMRRRLTCAVAALVVVGSFAGWRAHADGSSVITQSTEMHLRDGSVVRGATGGVVFVPTASNPAPPAGPAICTVDQTGACQPR